jgi:pyroglutamyl-peptidase I
VRILVTGFEPFGADTENASAEAVARLAVGWSQPGLELSTATLPVVFGELESALSRAVAESRPDLIIGVGEAGRRDELTPERYGRNRIEARIPDNARASPSGEIREGGPERLTTRFAVESVVEELRSAGLPASVSDDAGGYLCNHLAYLLYERAKPTLFVHVPAARSGAAATVGGETDVAGGPEHPAGLGSALDFDGIATGLALIVRHCAAAAARMG